MILKILILVFLLITIYLLLYFLMQIFIPVVSEQINNRENFFLSKFEHKFEKLENRSPFVPITSMAFIDSEPASDLSNLNLASFRGQNCKILSNTLKAVDSYKNVCLGFGDCIKQCPQTAIVLEKNTAKITNLCIGCGKCLQVCPNKLIKLIPLNSSSFKSEISGKKIDWQEKKGFKLWESCYKIISQK